MRADRQAQMPFWIVVQGERVVDLCAVVCGFALLADAIMDKLSGLNFSRPMCCVFKSCFESRDRCLCTDYCM